MPRFGLKNKRMLEVELHNEKVLALAGSMVAYEGQMRFEKSSLGGPSGMMRMLRRAVTGEGIPLMVSQGAGVVYFARDSQHVNIINLPGDRLYVESSRLLAYDQTLIPNVSFVGARGAASGQGLFTTTLEGFGNVAVTSHGDLIELMVDQMNPLFVDPDALVCWKGFLQQEFIFDVNWRNMVGQDSGESFQLKFVGQGSVFIQPSERK